jgi:hypothetical protein
MASNNWLTALGAGMQNAPSTGFYNDMFKSNDFAGIIDDVLRKSGNQNMSPYYQQYLMKNAKKWMIQEGLNQLASGVGPNEGITGENLGAALGRRIAGAPDGYIFDNSKTSQANFRQAISNAAKYYGEEYAGTGAYELAHTLFDDPEMLQAMMGQSLGEGYGGIFRNGLLNQMSKQFDRFKNNLDLGSGNWWNDMYGMYGGFAGNKDAPPALSGLPSMMRGSASQTSPYSGNTTPASSTPSSIASSSDVGTHNATTSTGPTSNGLPYDSRTQDQGAREATSNGLPYDSRAQDQGAHEAQTPYTKQELITLASTPGSQLPGIKPDEQLMAHTLPEAYASWYDSPMGRLAGQSFMLYSRYWQRAQGDLGPGATSPNTPSGQVSDTMRTSVANTAGVTPGRTSSPEYAAWQASQATVNPGEIGSRSDQQLLQDWLTLRQQGLNMTFATYKQWRARMEQTKSSGQYPGMNGYE